jgi:hypothetical protein
MMMENWKHGIGIRWWISFVVAILVISGRGGCRGGDMHTRLGGAMVEVGGKGETGGEVNKVWWFRIRGRRRLKCLFNVLGCGGGRFSLYP